MLRVPLANSAADANVGRISDASIVPSSDAPSGIHVLRSPLGRRRSPPLAARSLVFVLVSLWLTPVSGQVAIGVGGPAGPGGNYPGDAYYTALQLYRDGDMGNALDALETAGRSSRTDINGKWIDAIPLFTLQAECLWHIGDLVGCRASLDDAMRIAVRYRGWLGQVRWDTLDQPSGIAATAPTLWPEANAVRRLPLPRKMMFTSGQILTEQQLAAGGVIEGPNIKQIDAIEIVRSLAVLSYRRRIVLGPLAEQEPLAAELLEATKYPAGLPESIGKSLIGAMRGAEYLGNGNHKSTLDRIAQFASINQMAHPLTPVLITCGLLIGSGGDERGNLNEASSAQVLLMAQQAANAAAALQQPEWVGEALQIATGCATPQQQLAVERSATLASNALIRTSRLAAMHCSLVAADAAISNGRVDNATENLRIAITIASRRDVTSPRLQAYGAYIAARIAAAQGGIIGDRPDAEISVALRSIADFTNRHRNRNRELVSVPWNYQLGLIKNLMAGEVGNQSATLILEAFASGATIDRWRRDPVDALAASYSDQSAIRSALVRLAGAQNDAVGVLQASDRVLAHRFLDQTPLRGRVLQCRSLVSTPDDAMTAGDKAALEAAADLAAPIRNAVLEEARVPAAPTADETGVGIATAITAAVSVRSAVKTSDLESRLSQLTLRRWLVPAINPPPVTDADVESLAADKQTALLTFLNDGTQLIGTVTHGGETRVWTIPAARRLPMMINQLLVDIGASRNRGTRLPEDHAWQATAAKIKDVVLPPSAYWNEAGIERLIIVPDGALWYLPFELLPLAVAVDDPPVAPEAAAAAAPTWSDRLQVTYAPTPGFALHHVGTASPSERVALIDGALFQPRDVEANAVIVDEILTPLDRPLRATPADAPPTDRLGLEIGHLIVAAALTPNLTAPMATTLVPSDHAAARTNSPSGLDALDGWLRLPAGGPATVALPGFRTLASTGKLGDGSEAFFPLVSLRAAGVREVLLSRWPTGGESAAILVGELANETPHTSLVEAMTRGRNLLRQRELAIATEPILGKSDEGTENLTGNQPLFWSTYLTTGCLDRRP